MEFVRLIVNGPQSKEQWDSLIGTEVSREGSSISAPDRIRERKWAEAGGGSMATSLGGAGRWTVARE